MMLGNGNLHVLLILSMRSDSMHLVSEDRKTRRSKPKQKFMQISNLQNAGVHGKNEAIHSYSHNQGTLTNHFITISVDNRQYNIGKLTKKHAGGHSCAVPKGDNCLSRYPEIFFVLFLAL